MTRGTVVYGRCDAGGDARRSRRSPKDCVGGWRRCLRCSFTRWSATRHGRCPRSCRLTAAAPRAGGDEAASDVSTMADGVVKVVAAIADATGPCLVVLDAAHAADRTTLATAARLAALDVPVLMVILSHDPASADGVDLLALDGLDRPRWPRPRARRRASRGGRAAAGHRGPGSGRDPRRPPPGYRSGRAAGVERGAGTGRGTGRGRAVRRALSGASPYKGLLAYQADDADDFFGHDEDVAGLLAGGLDPATRWWGSSGSGKSWLVQAPG